VCMCVCVCARVVCFKCMLLCVQEGWNKEDGQILCPPQTIRTWVKPKCVRHTHQSAYVSYKNIFINANHRLTFVPSHVALDCTLAIACQSLILPATHLGTHTHTCTHKHACARKHAHAHTHMHTQTRMRTQTRTRTHTHVRTHTHTHTHMRAHMHAQANASSAPRGWLCGLLHPFCQIHQCSRCLCLPALAPPPPAPAPWSTAQNTPHIPHKNFRFYASVTRYLSVQNGFV